MAIFIDGDYYCETHNIRMIFDGSGGESCPICADHTEKIVIPRPDTVTKFDREFLKTCGISVWSVKEK